MNFINERKIPKNYKDKYYNLLGGAILKGKNSFYINQEKFKNLCSNWTVDYENNCFLASFPHGERGLAQTLMTFIFYWRSEFFYVAACRELELYEEHDALNYYQILCDFDSNIELDREIFFTDLKQALSAYGSAGAFSGSRYLVIFRDANNKSTYYHALIS